MSTPYDTQAMVRPRSYLFVSEFVAFQLYSMEIRIISRRPSSQLQPHLALPLCRPTVSFGYLYFMPPVTEDDYEFDTSNTVTFP